MVTTKEDDMAKKKELPEAKLITQRISWEDEGGMIQHDPGVLKCRCGDLMDLVSVWDNVCARCGRKYDLNGQEVIHG